MTLKEIYIKNYEDKIIKKELFVNNFNGKTLEALTLFLENEALVLNEWNLIHGDFVLSSKKTPKNEKSSIGFEDFSFDTILKNGISKNLPETSFIFSILNKYGNMNLSGCMASEFKKLSLMPPKTFRDAIQIVWLYMLVSLSVVSLDIPYENIDLILNSFLLEDIKNARTTDTEISHILMDFSCKLKLYRCVEEKNFRNTAKVPDIFQNDCLLTNLNSKISE